MILVAKPSSAEEERQREINKFARTQRVQSFGQKAENVVWYAARRAGSHTVDQAQTRVGLYQPIV